MPDELAQQMPILKEVLRAMNITIIEKEGYEVEGWNEVGNIGSAEYHEGDIIQINENTEYEAIYKKKIKVTFSSYNIY